MPKSYDEMSKQEIFEILTDAAKNWLAHDGCWFLAAEEVSGMDHAIDLDARAWEKYTVVEAKRIIKRHNIHRNGGLDALEQALPFRLQALLNKQIIVKVDNKLVIKNTSCRVQHARTRDGRPDFPCKSVGIKEYSGFASTIDPRIKCRCVVCPPDEHPKDLWCEWEFTLEEV